MRRRTSTSSLAPGSAFARNSWRSTGAPARSVTKFQFIRNWVTVRIFPGHSREPKSESKMLCFRSSGPRVHTKTCGTRRIGSLVVRCAASTVRR